MGRNRSWAHITSGATFDGLVKGIVALKSPGAKLFGRRGKDGGQDARSADGRRVFQFKHHASAAAKDAIADALSEADKIERYRAPGHARYKQWALAEEWQLVTNALFNPTDQQHWDEKVVPRFKALKLDADYWEQEDLNGFLDEYPWIDRAFFENELRAFHTVDEARERFADEEPFLPRAATNTFVGRTDELQAFRAFLNGTRPFLLVHGSGGTGKTRLLLEAGEDVEAEGDWQVLWANVASLSMSASWFEAIVPERKTLLLVDEPDDPKLLQVLAEQLGPRVGRLAEWKIAVAVRSPKDPVLRYFHGPRRATQVQDLPLGALAVDASVRMCRVLLDGKVPAESLDAAAATIAARFSRHPVWITLAVHLVESEGGWQQLPSTSKDLARRYLKEIIEKQDEFPQDEIALVLRWLALAGNINREALASLDLLAERAGIEDGARLGAIVKRLVDRRALIERGAHKRIVEVKPDVIRDRILIDWLTVEVGGLTSTRPTKAARELAGRAVDAFAAGKFAFADRITLTALARSELVLRLDDQEVDLLAPFWDGLRQAIPQLPAQRRVDLVEVLREVAPFRPKEVTECVRFLRTNRVETERVDAIFRMRDVGQADVVLALPWLEFHAALGANEVDCSIVLEEMCDLVVAEAEVLTAGVLPNDGKRAGQLLHRVLEGGPQFVSDYDKAGRARALRFLDELAKVAPVRGVSALIDALLVPLVSVERMQSWSSGNALHWRRYVIAPDDVASSIRTEVLERVRSILERAETPLESRLLLWRVLVESHRVANSSRDANANLDAEVLGDLQWARTALNNANLDELRAARDLWSWHLQFDEDPRIKEETVALEALYRSNAVADEFEELLRWDEPAKMDERYMKKAQELATADAAAVDAFVARGLSFLGEPTEVRRLLGVAFQLGRIAYEKPPVAEFVRASLVDAENAPRVEFAIEVLAGWIFDVRSKGEPGAVGLVKEWLTWCVDDVQRSSVLQRLFAWYGPVAEKGAEEQRFLRSCDGLFLRTGRGPAFVACVSSTFGFEWDEYSRCVTRVLDATPPEQLPHALALLIDGIDRGHRLDKDLPPPPELGRWVMDQVLRLPDLDSIAGNTQWHLDQIMDRSGHLPTTWLIGALQLRAGMEKQEPGGGYGGVGHTVHLAKYVVPFSAADKGDATAAANVEALFTYVNEHGSIGYKLPGILQYVDPEGVLVPDAVVSRIERATDYDALYPLARLAERYSVGTAPWRTIAKAVVRASAQVGERERRSLFHALGDPGPRSWSGIPGEVPPAFASARDAARARQDAETDNALRPYWEWYVAAAEVEFNEAEERAKEERGE